VIDAIKRLRNRDGSPTKSVGQVHLGLGNPRAAKEDDLALVGAVKRSSGSVGPSAKKRMLTFSAQNTCSPPTTSRRTLSKPP